MKEKDSQGEKGGNWKKLRTFLLFLFAIVLIASVAVAIYFAVGYWLSGNIVKHPPQPLDIAVAVLTILVMIVVVMMGYRTLKAQKEWDAFEKKTQGEMDNAKADWNKFKKEQEPLAKKTIEELEILMVKTEDVDWLNNLRERMKDDPQLDTVKAKETIGLIKEHYFERDKSNEAWGYFGVARWYEDKKRYDYAIKYCKKAEEVDLEEDNYNSNELHKHIRQSLGLNYFYRGRHREENGENEKAIEDYEAAILPYNWVIEYDPQFAMAHFNKASALIQIGKIEDKPEYYKQAISCLEKAIEIKDYYEHFYDKARAHALLDQRDEAIESLRHSFTLAERDLGKLFKYLKRDKQDFKNVEGKEEFKALLKRY